MQCECGGLVGEGVVQLPRSSTRGQTERDSHRVVARDLARHDGERLLVAVEGERLAQELARDPESGEIEHRLLHDAVEHPAP